MAETLGSIIDKLTIKSIREFYISRKLENIEDDLKKKELSKKLQLLKGQKNILLDEIESFIGAALNGEIVLRDEKLKLYNKPEMIDKIGEIETIAEAIDALANKNMELWILEDEARREDVELKHIGRVKKKIDFANQQRNDLIDKIDEILDKKIRMHKNK